MQLSSARPSRSARTRAHCVAIVGVALWATACGGGMLDPIQSLPPAPIATTGTIIFSARSAASQSVPGNVSIVVSARNSGANDGLVQYQGCAIGVRLYAASDLSGAVLYDTNRIGATCAGVQYYQALPPGASADLPSLSVEARQMRQSGVQAGHYFIGAVIAPAGVLTVLPAGSVDVAQ